MPGWFWKRWVWAVLAGVAVAAGSGLLARPDAPLVALAFECQVFDEIPVAAHDVFMDLVLTESRAIEGIGRKG
jgi:5-formyltetrahydrofolate cyclo-ligase